ncbi:hypothetical protein ACX80E_14425 [Arthrobacter sp. TMN-49]
MARGRGLSVTGGTEGLADCTTTEYIVIADTAWQPHHHGGLAARLCSFTDVGIAALYGDDGAVCGIVASVEWSLSVARQ